MTTTPFISSRPVLKLAGEERDDLQDALTAMVVHLPLSGPAHAELHLTNWGIRDDAVSPDFVLSELDLGEEIEVEMSGDGEGTRIFHGEITAIEERFGEGAPSIVLLAEDTLHHLGRQRHSRRFDDQSVDDVVSTIAAEAGLMADVQVSAVASDWHQMNESNAAFLVRLLSRFDISFRMDGDVLRARPEEPDPEPLTLSAQDSASKVRLIADLNHQPTSVRVSGYNAADAEDVDRDATGISPSASGTTAADELDRLGWAGDAFVPTPFAQSNAEADAYAAAHFNRQAKRFVHGDIVCQGEPSIRSGREVSLEGVSPRLCGTYRVVHCVHRFDNTQGYETHIKVSRPYWSH